MKYPKNDDNEILDKILNTKLHQRRSSAISMKSQTAEEIVENINDFDEAFQNPKTLTRMKNSYKYMRKLVNSLKGTKNITVLNDISKSWDLKEKSGHKKNAQSI
jgi:hypothetical protein